MVRNSAPKSSADETGRDTRLKLVLLGVALMLVAGYALTITAMGRNTVEGRRRAPAFEYGALLIVGAVGALGGDRRRWRSCFSRNRLPKAAAKTAGRRRL